MVLERLRHEFNRWAELGRGRGMEKSNWEVTRQLIDSMTVDEHDNIADLGCGLGWATRVLAQKASRGFVVGIDLSERMIALARSGSRNPDRRPHSLPNRATATPRTFPNRPDS
jgi:SAM-dependent methyltransferase